MSVTMFQPDQALTPHPFGPDLGDCARKILAQGDSWFSIGALPPWSTSNVLLELSFTEDVGVVNCAYPGRELRVMADPGACGSFANLMAGKFSWKWDAILISGGGNDLIAAMQDGLILDSSRWSTTTTSVARYVDAAVLNQFCANIASYMQQVIALRDSGQNVNVPLLFHTYDYAVPRNALAAPDVGPWMYQVVCAQGKNVPEGDWIALADFLIDKLAGVVTAVAGTNVFVVDTRNKLTPAAFGSQGVSGNWQNEIHPTPGGYSRLALSWEDVLEKCPARVG